MNLSPARLAVLVALVVGGIAVMMNGFGDDGAAVAGGGSDVVAPTGSETSEPTGSSTPTTTETPAPPELEPQVQGVLIQVLNGTDAVGLAAQAEEFLLGKGYEQGLVPGDLASKPVPGTTVYFRTGDAADQNKVNAERLANRYLKDVAASVKPLNDTLDADVAPKTELVVVLGDDYAEANPVV